MEKTPLRRRDIVYTCGSIACIVRRAISRRDLIGLCSRCLSINIRYFIDIARLNGLASKIVCLVPNAINSGIILGAGIGAVVSIFEVGGKFDLFP
ncbi:hypothetical protein LIT31_14745 [Peribacillus frigoritolerans]|nr:hypothetical protein [Peribacillus frigoritolerans]USK73115.1 hypothetical protein LIT31_14745 [Peribacillus frigoritolerans]